MTRLLLFLLAVTLSMTLAEFIEVQQLAPGDLRNRFDLSPSCEPSVTASTTDSTATSVTVAIDCRVQPPSTPPPATGLPGGRPRP